MHSRFHTESEERTVILVRNALVNTGDYNREELQFKLIAKPEIEDQRTVNALLSDLVNEFALLAHRNQAERDRVLSVEDQETRRAERLEQQVTIRRRVNSVFEYLKKNPKMPKHDIAVALGLTSDELDNAIWTLQREKRISVSDNGEIEPFSIDTMMLQF